MTFGQLFKIMNPDVRICKNGTCMWLYFDDVNYYTIGTEWWDKEIPDNAIAVLKEQEPRVYTYDEVNKLDDNLIEVVWFEAHNFAYVTPMLTRNTNFKNESSDWFKYGHDWRCWSARPTEEQREVVKWDD